MNSLISGSELSRVINSLILLIRLIPVQTKENSELSRVINSLILLIRLIPVQTHIFYQNTAITNARKWVVPHILLNS